MAFGLLIAGPGIGSAQQLGISTNTGNNLNIEHYTPTPRGLSTVGASKSQRWREFSVGLFYSYARNPLVLFADRLQVGEVVGHRFSQDLVGSIGILPWLEAGLTFPVAFYQTGDAALPTGELSRVGLRDARVNLKATLLTQDIGFIGIAIVPEVSFPTGNDSAFLGTGGVGFSPHLLVDRSFDILWGFSAALAVGIRLIPQAQIGNIEIDDELFYRLGVGVGLPNLWNKKPTVIAEVAGVTRLTSPFGQREQNAFTGSLAMRMTFDIDYGHRIVGTGGVTVGATRGYGSPDFQVFLGAVYQRYLSDRDKDGIYDDDDACPEDPEDKDGFEDLDGCPDPDNDRDGIPDVSDRCRDEPEDKDGFEDLDGCPDPDNDRDQIPDKVDACMNEAEDYDGFDDDDGCPEEDADRDGIPDDKDRCPEAKETINGVEDNDGCPDLGMTHVEVTSRKVTIDTRIMFAFDSARIRRESYGILKQVALTLKANPQLKKIRIEGHTDDRGGEVYNLELSQRRAESVMRYLVRRGVSSKRLEAVGYGEEVPVIPERNEAAWAKNRRVEFTIVEQAGVEGGTRKLEIE